MLPRRELQPRTLAMPSLPGRRSCSDLARTLLPSHSFLPRCPAPLQSPRRCLPLQIPLDQPGLSCTQRISLEGRGSSSDLDRVPQTSNMSLFPMVQIGVMLTVSGKRRTTCLQSVDITLALGGSTSALPGVPEDGVSTPDRWTGGTSCPRRTERTRSRGATPPYLFLQYLCTVVTAV